MLLKCVGRKKNVRQYHRSMQFTDIIGIASVVLIAGFVLAMLALAIVREFEARNKARTV
jgi:hypothetical protein